MKFQRRRRRRCRQQSSFHHCARNLYTRIRLAVCVCVCVCVCACVCTRRINYPYTKSTENFALIAAIWAQRGATQRIKRARMRKREKKGNVKRSIHFPIDTHTHAHLTMMGIGNASVLTRTNYNEIQTIFFPEEDTHIRILYRSMRVRVWWAHRIEIESKINAAQFSSSPCLLYSVSLISRLSGVKFWCTCWAPEHR